MKITEKDIQDLTKVEIVQVMEWCKKYLRKSSGILEQFFGANYEVTADKKDNIPIDEVYDKYIDYCNSNSLSVIDKTYFSKVIKDVLKNMGCDIEKADGKYYRVITNLKVVTKVDNKTEINKESVT